MREIKFRAWNKELNKMYSHEELLSLTKNIVMNKFTTGIYLPFNSDINLMQYTGLKDKDGTEIYEGDIVKGTLKGNSDEVLLIAHVKWDRGQFDLFSDFNSNSWENALYNYMQFYNVEVIGNIYENPELLNKK